MLHILSRYRTLIHTIRDLQGVEGLSGRAPPSNPPSRSPLTLRKCLGHETRSHPTRELVSVTLGQESQDTNLTTPLERQTTKSASRSLWRPRQTVNLLCRKSNGVKKNILIFEFSCEMCGLNFPGFLLQHVWARSTVYHQSREGRGAKVIRGTCKGHFIVTCKIIKEGATHRRVAREVSIMRKLGVHKNVLQLLDWNITQGKMERWFCVCFISLYSSSLHADPRVGEQWDTAQFPSNTCALKWYIKIILKIHQQCHIFNIFPVVHCDLALRNIMVNHFPREVKLAEFGLAQDLTHKRSHRSSCKVDHMQSVPLRWYPPEYFRNNYYSFKGDVWAFGIVLWEMQTFGKMERAPEIN
ncbi:unnamed protein product [Oncorhynchus mykiss]|uniref:Protein kinase domain-containing protein n=1 Tax=Oncorhynchus mykiss TaxID=8022 RepID=A0A060WU16_ONCMY|nr:unnamed protein product [Oncorhynchus mykiss]